MRYKRRMITKVDQEFWQFVDTVIAMIDKDRKQYAVGEAWTDTQRDLSPKLADVKEELPG